MPGTRGKSWVRAPPRAPNFMKYYYWHLFEWNRKIGRGYDTPSFSIYMQRWLVDFWLFSIRLHKFHRSDDDRAFHDHPWPFVTLMLRGGYWDVTENGENWIAPLSLRYRPLGYRHTVRLPEGKCSWSLVLTGRYQHRWGFYVKNKLGGERFVNSKRYFLENEHH